MHVLLNLRIRTHRIYFTSFRGWAFTTQKYTSENLTQNSKRSLLEKALIVIVVFILLEKQRDRDVAPAVSPVGGRGPRT